MAMNLIKSDLIWDKFGPSYTCKPNVDRISTTTNESLGPKRAIWPNNSVADKVVFETNAKWDTFCILGRGEMVGGTNPYSTADSC